MKALPLDGIRVIELGSTVAAPAAARLLADFGADVVKIEPPEGDHLRRWGELAPDGTSWWFKSHNRNKSFVCLDLRQRDDRLRARELILGADAVIENFRPGVMAGWGMGYAELAAEHPGLIYVSISGYGQDGPKAERPGFGHIAEGISGFRYVTGYEDRPPVRVGLSVGDEIAALYAAFGTLAALQARRRDGRGDHIDVSLVEGLFSLSEALLPEYAHAGRVTERAGNRYLRAAPSGIYTTADGRHLSIAANSEPIFRRLCAAMGQEGTAADPRFATNQARIGHSAALDDIISAWAGARALEPALAILAAAGVPAGPVNSIADIVADPHFQARGAIAEVSSDDGDRIATPGLVPRLRNHPGRLAHAARAVGADQHRVDER
ncbi:CaiB/BaiF CoA transferase family protein [Chelatococcus asaccharovorans]|uniref:Formyl-CoA transferase n=1 Tax=Chelatococcus asaccharovorans TaxID=28210 RepID=A0A2V3TYS8_9HYPH|nr:CoA transferase [Chelatococcus asaccharovorans]MBS7707774.1 CoA transferase [Chelatococcus asaccharovorans]PXW55071.1 formyl-CoA transferase [Chelatococcus asaccharovorans]